jgi:beta-glucosidase
VLSDPLSCDFLTPQAPAIAMPESQGYQTQVLTYDQLRDLHLPASGHLLQLFIRGNPFRGRAGLSAAHEQQLKDLLSSALVQAIVVYGSPYVQNWIMQQISSDQVLLFSYGQMPSAQEHLCACLFGSQDSVAPRDRVFT